MEKIKKLIKHAFSTPDNIEEMSFLEIVIDSIIGGFVIAIVLNLLKILFVFLGLIVLLVVLVIFF